jgi:lysozyme family protein
MHKILSSNKLLIRQLVFPREEVVMASLKLTDALRTEYGKLFNTCVIRPERHAEIDRAAKAMIANKARYQAVSAKTGVPWTVIAVNHQLECNLSFNRHLHNGDPLSAKTVQVPKGRPPGNPPWTWEVSAADALREYAGWKDWTLAGTLFMLERYNGPGYRLYHPSVLSPYLWSFSAHYTKGKYAADGVWSPTLVSKQTGAAVLLRRLAELGESAFADEPKPAPNKPPMVVPYAKNKPTDAGKLTAATALQMWLNTHPGIFVKTDGWAGSGTSNAYKVVTGHYLPGDPRGA